MHPDYLQSKRMYLCISYAYHGLTFGYHTSSALIRRNIANYHNAPIVTLVSLYCKYGHKMLSDSYNKYWTPFNNHQRMRTENLWGGPKNTLRGSRITSSDNRCPGVPQSIIIVMISSKVFHQNSEDVPDINKCVDFH